MRIGDLVRQMVDEREPREPSDLLNGPDRPCTCDGACTGHMPEERPDKYRGLR